MATEALFISLILNGRFSPDQFHVLRKTSGQPESGWMLFIYGNDGWDVIADYTVNLEPALKGATELADKIATEEG